MSKVKRSNATLSGLIDSDSEGDPFAESMPTPDSGAENLGKKGRGRPKVAPMKVTKAKAPARRSSGRLNVKAKAPAAQKKGKRQVLADRTNQQLMSDTEEVDEFALEEDPAMEIEDTVLELKAAKPKPTKNKVPAKRGQAAKEIVSAHTNGGASPEKPKTRPGRKKAVPKPQAVEEPSPEKIVLESQVPIDVDMSANEVVEESVSRTAHNASHSRSESRMRQPSVARRRAGSASDTERSDPNLRRKLGDMTKKYDSLHIKYQDLREMGVKEMERNYDRLVKETQTKEKSKLYPTLLLFWC